MPLHSPDASPLVDSLQFRVESYLEGRLPRRPRSGWNRILHTHIEDEDEFPPEERQVQSVTVPIKHTPVSSTHTRIMAFPSMIGLAASGSNASPPSVER